MSDQERPYGGGTDNPALKRVRTRHFQRAKENGIKITGLSSYDCLSAQIFDDAGIDFLLVGDSAGNTVFGYDTTLPVTIDELIPLTRAVAHAVSRALVIADLLGVPPEDREVFEEQIAKGQTVGSIENSDKPTDMTTMHFIGSFMARYLQERAANPGADLLSELATADYPDGSKPDFTELVSLSTFMFAAGQDTSAKLLCNAMRYVVDIPGLQQQLREDRSLIPWMLEEVLRLEGSTKATHRVTRRDTTIGGRNVPAGTQVIVAIAAANRDPKRWGEDADEFKLKRPGVREHIAFSRGSHTCAGAPLARAEVAMIFNSFFDQTSEILISEQVHGPCGSRQYQFEPSFIIRGMDNLHLDLKAS